MIPSLTPDQWAKIKRGWVWRPAHAFVQPHPKTGVCDYSSFARVSCVVDGEPMAMRGVGISNPHPVLTDDATADGMARTARAMWRDESLHVVPHDTNVNDGKGDTMPARWWAVARVVESEPWVRSASKEILVACEDGTLRRYLAAPTESAAWLAAILAAPEAK